MLFRSQRLIVELGDKVHKLMDYVDASQIAMVHAPLQEVESALMALGFNAGLIQRELKLLGPEEREFPEEKLIKEVIKRLYQRAK